MRRVSILAIVVLVGLAAARPKPRSDRMAKVTSAAVRPSDLPQPGVVTVRATCPATEDAEGAGIRIRPWTVHTRRPAAPAGAVIRWHLVPGNDTTSLALEPVDAGRWPFKQVYYQAHPNELTAELKSDAEVGRYAYRLRITCPDGQVMVIDPIVIVDP